MRPNKVSQFETYIALVTSPQRSYILWTIRIWLWIAIFRCTHSAGPLQRDSYPLFAQHQTCAEETVFNILYTNASHRARWSGNIIMCIQTTNHTIITHAGNIKTYSHHHHTGQDIIYSKVCMCAPKKIYSIIAISSSSSLPSRASVVRCAALSWLGHVIVLYVVRNTDGCTNKHATAHAS